MKSDKLENEIIKNCAPTLASLKCASLFQYFYDTKENTKQNIKEEIQKTNDLLNNNGVYIEALQWNKNSVLLYVYRNSHLQRELNNPRVKMMLKSYGYFECDIKCGIQKLKERLESNHCFPHEIGLFLGYPFEDVVGFIENKGQNCKYCGLWKVYGNESEKIQLFRKLEKCSEIYQRALKEGVNLIEMTVCA